MNIDFKKGQFVEVFQWNAIVLDVFCSESGRVVFELHFAKDVVKNYPPEMHVLAKEHIKESSRAAFLSEITAIRGGQDEKIKELTKVRLR